MEFKKMSNSWSVSMRKAMQMDTAKADIMIK
jgi:hypothetical protein